MGFRYRHHCKACGYEVDVPSKIDVGFASKTATVTCATCKPLFDLLISEEPWKEGLDPREDVRCPNEKGDKHKVRPWPVKRPCPRCGETMRKRELTFAVGLADERGRRRGAFVGLSITPQVGEEESDGVRLRVARPL
jgi:hypothetical protein